MKYKKLLGSALLFATLLSGCGGGSKKDASNDKKGSNEKIEELTKDDITLSMSTWFEADYMDFMAKKFTEKYPNIKVNVIDLSEADNYNDGLSNLAADKKLPDVFAYNSNSDLPIMNGWFYDFTKYYDADEDVKDMLTTLQNQGRFDGKRVMAAAVNYYPYAVFVDENLLKKENVAMPSDDYKYSDLVNLVKKMTIPEKKLFGYEGGSTWVTMAPIIEQDAIGEFGWNGKKFDLTKDWADAVTQMAEFQRSGVRAPDQGTDEAEAAFGNRDAWSPTTGQVAVKLGALWDATTFESEEYKNKGINFVPYTIPHGDRGKEEHKPAYIDMGGISSATEHPREAYELLKFIGWGKDGWDARMDFYKGLKTSDPNFIPKVLPLTNEQKYWDDMTALMPDTEYYKNFMKHSHEPIPLGGRVLPGFETWINEVYFDGEYGNVETAVMEGKVNAHDVAPELTEKANTYHEEAMEELFNQ